MKPDIFSGLPMYVRQTILSQIRRLLSTPLFTKDDREDLMQDLLLFYLKRFYSSPETEEALVVHAIRQYTTTLIIQRYRRRDFMNSSLSDYSDEEFFCAEDTSSQAFNRALIKEIMDQIDSKKVKMALRMVLRGSTFDEASKHLHVSKETIYKFFKKIKKL